MERQARKELYQAGKAIQNDIESVLGRMARVVETNAHMVQVEVPAVNVDGDVEWTGPLGPYPSATNYTPVGTTGILTPIQGGQAFFVPMGRTAPRVWSIATSNGSRQSSTSITDWTASASYNTTLPPGIYEINIQGLSAYKRSVATGGAELRITPTGLTEGAGPTNVRTYDANVGLADFPFFPVSTYWRGEVTITETVDVTWTFEWKGHTTAGTTWFYGTLLFGYIIETSTI